MNDDDLSREGVRQARKLGEYARRNNITPTEFYSSLAKCALRSHQLSTQVMGIDVPPVLDGRFQELNLGDWTGKPRSIQDEPQVVRERRRKGHDFTPPGGESINAARRRALAALGDIMAKTPPGEYIWVHTHSNLIKAVVQPWFRWPAEEIFEVELGVVSLTRIKVDNRRLKVVFFNRLTL